MMMPRTDRQNNCLQKALRYKNSESVSEALGKIYLTYCEDGYESFDSFMSKVGNSPDKKILYLSELKEVEPTLPFKTFLQRYERELTPKEEL